MQQWCQEHGLQFNHIEVNRHAQHTLQKRITYSNCGCVFVALTQWLVFQWGSPDARSSVAMSSSAFFMPLDSRAMCLHISVWKDSKAQRFGQWVKHNLSHGLTQICNSTWGSIATWQPTCHHGGSGPLTSLLAPSLDITTPDLWHHFFCGPYTWHQLEFRVTCTVHRKVVSKVRRSSVKFRVHENIGISWMRPLYATKILRKLLAKERRQAQFVGVMLATSNY